MLRLGEDSYSKSLCQKECEGECGTRSSSSSSQVWVDPLAEQVTNTEFRASFQVLAQAKREVEVPMNPNMGMTASRVTYFTIMNPPEFHGSRVEKDPQEFIDEVYKVLMIMGVTSVEKAPTMFADPRAKMSKFVSDVSKMVVEECRTTMLVNDMDISRLMVHAQQIEEEKLKGRSREAKRAKTGDDNFSRSNGHGRSMFRQRFSSQGSSNAPSKFNKDRMSNPKPQGGNCSGSLLPTCAKYGRKHEGKCLAGSNACFGCGKKDHKIRDCHSVAKNEGDNSRRAQPNPSSSPSGLVLNAPKQNQLYALQTHHEQEGSPDVPEVRTKPQF
uniref:Gag-pol polyprotein n=1 Tax=Solanum tuberosum TaxID=4113 RepID=M1DGP0_SOLTU